MSAIAIAVKIDILMLQYCTFQKKLSSACLTFLLF